MHEKKKRKKKLTTETGLSTKLEAGEEIEKETNVARIVEGSGRRRGGW